MKKKFIVIIDGPMGAGKSTVGALVHKRMKRTALLGMDRIKWFISDFRRRKKDNAITNAVLIQMCDSYLAHGISTIITQGFSKEFTKPYIKLAKKHKAKLLFFQLNAPKAILFRRVKSRKHSVAGRPPIALSRIERNFRKWKNYEHQGKLYETDKLSAKKVANEILKEIKNYE